MHLLVLGLSHERPHKALDDGLCVWRHRLLDLSFAFAEIAKVDYVGIHHFGLLLVLGYQNRVAFPQKLDGLLGLRKQQSILLVQGQGDEDLEVVL